MEFAGCGSQKMKDNSQHDPVLDESQTPVGDGEGILFE